MDYSAAALAQLAGNRVYADLLVEFQFVSETIRLRQNGFGDTTTTDAKTWKGMAGLGSISGIAQSINGAAPPLTLSLTGVDSTFATKAKGERTEYYNQPLVVYLQFFDDDWQCLDAPYALTMARMTALKSNMNTDGDGLKTYTVSITAETPFAVRRRPAYGYWTDRDQQQRYPGDRGLERVAGIDNKIITFPVV